MASVACHKWCGTILVVVKTTESERDIETRVLLLATMTYNRYDNGKIYQITNNIDDMASGGFQPSVHKTFSVFMLLSEFEVTT